MVVVRRSLGMMVVAAALGLAAVLPASGAAGPRYILVHGGGLPAPLLLEDLAANELLVSSPDILPLAIVDRAEDRPAYELALFFIVPDLNGRSPSSLDPSETQAIGRFYPAVGELEAAFELGAVRGIGPRRNGSLTPPMLDYLVSRGVPVTSDVQLGPEQPSPTPTAATDVPRAPAADGGNPAWLVPSLVSAGLLILLVGAFAVSGRRRKPRRNQLHW